jgi:O-antigen/teichoic acid export membrane protein
MQAGREGWVVALEGYLPGRGRIIGKRPPEEAEGVATVGGQTQGGSASPQGGKHRPFRARILHAASWSMGGYVLLQFLRIASSLVLTRLLIPEMFGVMAVATMVQVAVAMLSDVGLRPAAIQSRMGDEPAYLNTAWTLQLAHGVLIWLVCTGIAWGIAQANGWGWFPPGSVYAEPALPTVIAVLCFVTVISGLQSTKIITAYRELALARVTGIELVAQLVSLAVAVALAWQTRSIWSFVAAAWCSAVVSTVLSYWWLPGHNNRFAFDRQAVNDLIRFGKWVLLSSAFTVLAANGDKILLAGWVTPTMLGLYALGFNLVAMLEGAGNRLFSSVAMPALSKVHREEPQRLATVFLKMRLPFDITFVCAAGAMFAMGTDLIDLLYDERYAGAAVVLKILSFGLLIARFGVISNVYLAIGKPRHLTLLNLVRGLSVFTLVPLGYTLNGFEGALWAIALHGLPGTFLLWSLNRRHHLNSLGLEVATLCLWPLGYAGGWLGSWVLAQIVS